MTVYALFETWLISHGFEEEWKEDWQRVLERFASWEFGAQGEHWPLMFKDKKGSDINEFPCGLRVRQFPIQRGVG